MKYSSSFTYDLRLGEKAEDWAQELFGGAKKIEVKLDFIAHRTGNIFVEVYSRGNKSGITTTTADYWIYKIAKIDSAAIIPVARLRELVKRYYNGKFTKGGDDDTSLGVLIPLSEIYK
jgi:hypothetical protein